MRPPKTRPMPCTRGLMRMRLPTGVVLIPEFMAQDPQKSPVIRRNDPLGGIKTKSVGSPFAFLGIRTVAEETIVGQDRADVACKIHRTIGTQSRSSLNGQHCQSDGKRKQPVEIHRSYLKSIRLNILRHASQILLKPLVTKRIRE